MLRVNSGDITGLARPLSSSHIFMHCLIEIGFSENHIWGGAALLVRTARLDVWSDPIYPVNFWSSFREPMWNCFLTTAHFFLSFMLSTMCRKPAFIRMLLKVLVEFLSQIFGKHSLHFILIFRVWRMSSYWMQTCVVLKIWLTIALKMLYSSGSLVYQMCIVLLKIHTLGFYPQRYWLGRPKEGP